MFCMRYKLCFSNNWYHNGLQFQICITCFVSFGIKDGSFIMLEDFFDQFFVQIMKLLFTKTEIDIKMMSQFDVKCVLN